MVGGGPLAGELAAQVEVLAVGLFEGVSQGSDFGAVLFLQLNDLLAECVDEGVIRIRCGGGVDRSGGGAQPFDAGPQFGMVVEEGVGDAGLALDGLEGDAFAAFEQTPDGLLGIGGLAGGFGLGGGDQGGCAVCMCGGQGRVLRVMGMRVSGIGPVVVA